MSESFVSISEVQDLPPGDRMKYKRALLEFDLVLGRSGKLPPVVRFCAGVRRTLLVRGRTA